MQKPEVSVIIPTKNRLHYLQRAIQSVLNQTIKNIQIIVVDDASTDMTRNYLDQLKNNIPNIIVITNVTSSGGAVARNQGVEKADGTWIAFLDDDDEWMSDKLFLQLQIMKNSYNAIACSTNYIRCTPDRKNKLIKLPLNVTFNDLLMKNTLGGASMCLCSRSVFYEIGGFDPLFKSGQDWDFWLRLSLKGKILCCPDPTVLYNAHEGKKISTDMKAQYHGARHFHLKYKSHMNNLQRKYGIGYIFYIKSRQLHYSAKSRINYLFKSIYVCSFSNKLGYTLSSFPRLIMDIVSN